MGERGTAAVRRDFLKWAAAFVKHDTTVAAEEEGGYGGGVKMMNGEMSLTASGNKIESRKGGAERVCGLDSE